MQHALTMTYGTRAFPEYRASRLAAQSEYRMPILSNGYVTVRPYAQRMTFGERLRKAREAKGWTGDDLGQKIGISKQHISHWEVNRHQPRIGQLMSLCTALNVSADQLLFGQASDALTPEAFELAKHYDASTPDEQETYRDLLRVAGKHQQLPPSKDVGATATTTHKPANREDVRVFPTEERRGVRQTGNPWSPQHNPQRRSTDKKRGV
jgi:transcriptional regulator with XRE-family HTH domain